MDLVQADIAPGLECPKCHAALKSSEIEVRGERHPRMEVICPKCHVTVLRAEFDVPYSYWR